jgi:hypothetical protein
MSLGCGNCHVPPAGPICTCPCRKSELRTGDIYERSTFLLRCFWKVPHSSNLLCTSLHGPYSLVLRAKIIFFSRNKTTNNTFSNDFLTKRTGVVDVNVRSDQINVIEINFLCQNLQHLTFSYLLIFFATFAHQIITNFGGKPSRNRPKVRPEINVAMVFVSVKLRKYTDTGVRPLGSVRTRLPLCLVHLSISVAEPPNFNLIPSILISHLTLSTLEIKLNPVLCRVHPIGGLENPRFHQNHKQVNRSYNIFNYSIHHNVT